MSSRDFFRIIRFFCRACSSLLAQLGFFRLIRFFRRGIYPVLSAALPGVEADFPAESQCSPLDRGCFG
jgi:hypothetical protein